MTMVQKATNYAANIAEQLNSMTNGRDARLMTKAGAGVVGSIVGVSLRGAPNSGRRRLAILMMLNNGDLHTVNWYAEAHDLTVEILERVHNWRKAPGQASHVHLFAPGF
jgi:hypothetical protein